MKIEMTMTMPMTIDEQSPVSMVVNVSRFLGRSCCGWGYLRQHRYSSRNRDNRTAVNNSVLYLVAGFLKTGDEKEKNTGVDCNGTIFWWRSWFTEAKKPRMIFREAVKYE